MAASMFCVLTALAKTLCDSVGGCICHFGRLQCLYVAFPSLILPLFIPSVETIPCLFSLSVDLRPSPTTTSSFPVPVSSLLFLCDKNNKEENGEMA